MKFDLIEACVPVMAFTFGCLVTILSLQIIVIDPIKKEAIEKGYASWEITNKATGRTAFKFK